MNRINSWLNLITKPQAHSLKLQSIRAIIWSLLEKGSGQALRMAGSLILTRILYPEAFGIMATAQIFIVMIQLFTDVGVRLAIIQNEKGAEPEFLDTAWIICVIRGALLSFIVALMAWPVSLYYAQPELKGILLIMSLSPFILGLENPALALVIRRLRVEKKVALEVGSQALGLTSSVILAWLMQSVFALAIGVVLSYLYKVIGSFIVEPYLPRLRMNREYGLQIFHFGKFIFVNTFIGFAAMNADILLIGKVLHMKDLGMYSIGRNIGTLIWTICLQTFLQSYMPAVSSVQNDRPRIIRMYRNFTAVTLALTTPVSMVIALFSRDIIRILYDPRYQDASISMFWFSISGVLLVLNAINSNTFIAMGKLKFETISTAISLVLVCFLIPLGAMYYGLSGAAAGMFIAIAVMVTAQSICLCMGLKFPVSYILQPWYQVFLIPACISCIYYLLRPILETTSLYNLPFLFVMGIMSLTLSGLFYLYRGRALSLKQQAS